MDLKDFSFYLDSISEYGIVEQINPPIVVVSGLPYVKPSEIVLFETGQIGQVFSIGKDMVEILLFSSAPVSINSRVVRTNQRMSVPVGEEYLGKIINPLGEPIIKTPDFKYPTEKRSIDTAPEGISKRKRIGKTLFTGSTLIDLMIPLGKGQRQLVIGDRKTGKSSFLMTTMKNQALEGNVVIYAAIARKRADIKKIQDFLVKENIVGNVIIVASDAHDSAGLIYVTPYSAMTLAEYFRDRGRDVLIVFDDLSTHAKFYRELSLMGRRFPGRDSYPGDIFYLHARLMERAGNFAMPGDREGSITSLPVAEIIEGDLAGYIATNLMGMTDGHIYFDSNAYYQGRRPAVNISLSVTRVGRQAQDSLRRDMNRELTSFLSLYERMQTFSHFGAELADEMKQILAMGERIYSFFQQPYDNVVPYQVQAALFSLIWLRSFNEEETQKIEVFRERLNNAYASDIKVKNMLDKMMDSKTFNEYLSKISRSKIILVNICKTEKK